MRSKGSDRTYEGTWSTPPGHASLDWTLAQRDSVADRNRVPTTLARRFIRIGPSIAQVWIAALACQAAPIEWLSFAQGRYATVRNSSSNRGVGFTQLSPAQTSITFTNSLSDTSAALNQIRLNGSGVALGDLNGDGLCDIYLCGLENPNALYLNLGDWRFTNVTVRAGVACDNQFSTGATVADVDGDGDLDLLVNGIGTGTRLFLNDGQAHFTERTDSGLLRTGGATSLALADIDGDGDLDLYVANYRSQTIRSTGYFLININGKRSIRPEDRQLLEMTPDGRILELGEPDILYLNQGNGRFTAVDWTQGRFLDDQGLPLSKPPPDWGLTAMFRDLNQDGFPDLYVCNDFHSPDRIWMNDGKGNFRALAPLSVRHTPTFSMSIDVADMNRDGFDDWLIVDMLSRSEPRRLMKLASTSPYESTEGSFDNRPQYDRNVFQLNRGNGTWSDIACIAGLEATDWTWSAVFLDVDLDGYEDLLCTTGHGFDIQDLDAEARIVAKGPWPQDKVPFKVLMYPRLPQSSHAFRNNGDLTFSDKSVQWNFNREGIAHGMALADLDNDGDLDVVVNTLNDTVGIYRNDATGPRIGVRLRGTKPNNRGIGARMELHGHGLTQSQEMLAGGRYLSSDDPMRTFAALGTNELDLQVRWRSGKVSQIPFVKADRIYEVDEATASFETINQTSKPKPKPLFEDLTDSIQHTHTDKPFDDFQSQPLLPRKLSQSGPGISWFDSRDGSKTTLLIGAGVGGKVHAFSCVTNGTITRDDSVLPDTFALGDVTSLVALDLPGMEPSQPNSTLVLQAVSSYESPASSVSRLQILSAAQPQIQIDLPEWNSSPGPLAMADIDGDGDLDLFVGGRVIPGKWPAPASSLLLQYHERRFVPDREACSLFHNVGLVSGALFSDIDGDGDPDLILACEWGPVRVFRNNGGEFTEVTRELGFEDKVGWWNGVAAGDFNGDGRMDLVASNWGWNDGTAIRNGVRSEPVIVVGDLRGDGGFEFMEGHCDSKSGRTTPSRPLNILGSVLPGLRDRFGTFAEYNQASLSDVLGGAVHKANRIQATWLAATVFMNRGTHFEAIALPVEAQLAPTSGVCVADFNQDGSEDIFLAQNFFPMESTSPRCDAGQSVILLGNGEGQFRALSSAESGVQIFGEGRGAAVADYDADGRVDLAVGQNSGATRLFRGVGSRIGITVRAIGPRANPGAIGASLRIDYGRTKGPRREIRAGTGYLSQDSPSVTLGLSGVPEAVEVRWPDGTTTNHPFPRGRHRVTVRHPAGISARGP